MRRNLSFLALSCVLAGDPALADEGMWTFNHFPAATVAARHGFLPSADWLSHLQAASLRLAGGCSASFVSGQGLVLTNHHCARDCVEALSGLAGKDYNRNGFFARSAAQEQRCPGMEANRLETISDVTARMRAATQGLAASAFAAAQRSAVAAIESECATSDALRCEVVSLFQGGRYELYRFARMADVRLVFAPEDAIANFGGDPDNFNFPRYSLDMTLLRVYGPDGKALATPQHLAWSTAPVQRGELVFVSGNPGGTSRGNTVAQMQASRDQFLPAQLLLASELRGFLRQYQLRGAEQRRHSSEMLLNVENWLKGIRGEHGALADPRFMDQLEAQEAALRAATAAQPELQAEFGDVWDRIAEISQRQRAQSRALGVLEGGQLSPLLSLARDLVRYAEEIDKPDGERLRPFSHARLPELRQRLQSPEPHAQEFEIAQLSFGLTRLREELGADDALVQSLFKQQSPAQLARAAVRGSRMHLQSQRQAWLKGGPAAIRGSQDPLLQLARAIDPAARAARKLNEESVQGPRRQQQERLARLRFAVQGDSSYPDATFTPRISFGTVQGWEEGGRSIAPFTLLAGAYARHTGAEPFELPASWLRARARLALDTPFNFTLDTDIIGGNSGSPVVNTRGEIVGLVFDGNLHSLGGQYGFDAALNRTVAVHASGMREVLDQVYGAQRLLDEMAAP